MNKENTKTLSCPICKSKKIQIAKDGVYYWCNGCGHYGSLALLRREE